MRKHIWTYIIVGVGLGVILGILWGIFQRQESIAPTVNGNANSGGVTNQATGNHSTTVKQEFTTADLPDRDPAFNFSAKIPVGWVAEYVAGSHAINFYDPKSAGKNSLGQSQIFVKYFKDYQFLVSSTVDVRSHTETKAAGRPAVTYIVQKKSDVPDFTNQPSWRNQEHRTTDVRSSDAAPTVFYIFAKSPSLADGVFEDFLASLKFQTN